MSGTGSIILGVLLVCLVGECTRRVGSACLHIENSFNHWGENPTPLRDGSATCPKFFPAACDSTSAPRSRAGRVCKPFPGSCKTNAEAVQTQTRQDRAGGPE